ncbi:methylamine dehydrogenase [Shewanella psychropiezotolerans]|uniref:Methylamine dehydrogenase n=1 Tax=Shewanella psychropiezotolerans TaxID=2593655 RepID=A0ABX5WW35_9GAMM|nr:MULTISPECIES: amine dehydrogenase large subunit [Shewanella]MPY22361.1 methylamine dehydrogenase [Shewanella sp. YLB-07]QDO83307.1 methylamine dehydrogenase [Shewanella psychropiezotolerans]
MNIRSNINTLKILVALLLLQCGYAFSIDSSAIKKAINPKLPPLPIEETGNVMILPDVFPETWMFVDETSFTNMFGGKMILLDVAETRHSKRIKGTADKNLMGNFIQAKTRPEFYIMESFHTRGARGPLTDVLTIYNKTTMAVIKELVWKDRRLQALPRRNAMALSADEKFLYVANFSPAGSFTVVELNSKKIIETIETPGCVLTFSTGIRSISSLCSNGGMLTTVIDEKGHLKSRHRLKPFFDTDKSPIFERPAIIDGIAYFPSFDGLLHELNLSGKVAKHITSWSLLNEQERKQNWRPGGLALNDSDEQGLMYIIMHSDGHDGTQTQGGSQVWIFDVRAKKRIKVIDIPNWAVSIALTRGIKPLLVVTNGELNLDIYNPESGELIQTLKDFGNISPLVIHKAY